MQSQFSSEANSARTSAPSSSADAGVMPLVMATTTTPELDSTNGVTPLVISSDNTDRPTTVAINIEHPKVSRTTMLKSLIVLTKL